MADKKFWSDFAKRVGLKTSDTLMIGNSDTTDAEYTTIEDLIGLVPPDSHPPYIGEDGYWYEWSVEDADYVNTGVQAQGGKGDTGYGIPVGGVVGQVITKKSTTDYDVEWGPGVDEYVVDPNYVHTDNNYTTAEKNKLAGLATVATTGNYSDLSGKPTLGTSAAKNIFIQTTEPASSLGSDGDVCIVYTA